MEIKNCKRCKKLFQYLSGPVLCPKCKEDDEKDFQKVKQYLKENPNATMTEVSEALEMSVEKITRYLKEGRLQVSADSPMKIECEGCGTLITSGRYCDKCSGKMEEDFEKTSKELRERSSRQSERMMKYFRNDENK